MAPLKSTLEAKRDPAVLRKLSLFRAVDDVGRDGCRENDGYLHGLSHLTESLFPTLWAVYSLKRSDSDSVWRDSP